MECCGCNSNLEEGVETYLEASKRSHFSIYMSRCVFAFVHMSEKRALISNA